MQIVATDLHSNEPYADRRRQDWVLDYIDDQEPTGVIFGGDTLGKHFSLDNPVLARIARMAARMCVVLVPGNFPHDDADFLLGMAERIRPVHVWRHDDPMVITLTADARESVAIHHGWEWDPRLRFWRVLRYPARVAPRLTRWMIGRAPSELVADHDWTRLRRLLGVIHQRAAVESVRKRRHILAGHTHMAQTLRTGQYRAHFLGAAGVAAGPAYLARIEDPDEDGRRALRFVPIPTDGRPYRREDALETSELVAPVEYRDDAVAAVAAALPREYAPVACDMCGLPHLEVLA